MTTVKEMEARTIARYVGQTGQERANTIDYMSGVLAGRWGTVSEAGRNWARRILIAMGAEGR